MNSARSRAQTEPDVCNTIEVEERPISAHEFRQYQREVPAPPPEAISALSSHLGIPMNQRENDALDWIVRDCLITLRENGWDLELATTGKDADLIFTHLVTGEKRSELDVAVSFRELSRQILFEQRTLEEKRLDPDFRIREIVNDRLRRVRDPRNVNNPSIIETILQLLKIQASVETHLAHIVREELSSAYFRMVSLGGPEFINQETCISVETLRTRVAIERMRHLIKMSKSRLLFCVECQNSLADGSCASCGDCLCGSCFNKLHSKGQRRDHSFVFLDQAVCSECDSRAAELRCTDCGDLMCPTCLEQTHQRGRRVKHCIQLALPVFCLNCEINEARVICLDCHDALCLSCSDRQHRRGAQTDHILYGIKSYAYPNKLFASNCTAILRVLDKIIRPPTRSDWQMFFDDQMGPYWYNFATQQRVSGSLNDIGHPPSDEHPSAMDHKVSERAIFEVPDPIRIKFKHMH